MEDNSQIVAKEYIYLAYMLINRKIISKNYKLHLFLILVWYR